MRNVNLLLVILLAAGLFSGCNKKIKEGCPAEQAYQASQKAGPQEYKPTKAKSGALPTDGKATKYSTFKKKNNKRKRKQ